MFILMSLNFVAYEYGFFYLAWKFSFNFFPLFVFSIPENVIGCKFEEKSGRETNLTIRTSHLLRKFKASSLQSGKKYTVQISKKEDARYKKFCAISFHFRRFKASILLFIFCSYSCFIWLLRMKG